MAGKNWDEDLCGCCNDFESCICAWFIPCLQYGRNVHQLTPEKGTGAWCCLCCISNIIPIIPVILICMNRTEIREKYGIAGGPVADFCCSMCCHCCVLAQAARQLKRPYQQ